GEDRWAPVHGPARVSSSTERCCSMTLVAHKDVARRLAAVALALFAVLLSLAAAPAASHAAACTPPIANPIACENSKPGADPSTWQITKSGDDNIQGYATQMSVTP